MIRYVRKTGDWDLVHHSRQLRSQIFTLFIKTSVREDKNEGWGRGEGYG